MICKRNHQFYTRTYSVHIESSVLYLKRGKHAKYSVKLDLCSQIEWIVQDQILIGFMLQGSQKTKRFDMSPESCAQLRSLLSCQVSFSHIKNHYKVIYVLGRGSFGKVFKVKDTSGNIFACKTMRHDAYYSVQDIRNEIHIQTLMHHVNILKIKEVFQEDGYFYLIMEYAEGDTLRQYLSKHRVSDNEIIEIMKQVLSAIQHINDKGYVHRDVKPDNILLMMFESLNSLKLTDFGFAAGVDEIETNHPYCGTPGYMAPEIIKYDGSAKYNESCDSFSCGVLLYRLITNEDLFLGSHSEIYYQQENFQISHLDSSKLKHTPFKQILLGMLENNPNKRMTISHAIEQFSEMSKFHQPPDYLEVNDEGTIQKVRCYAGPHWQ